VKCWEARPNIEKLGKNFPVKQKSKVFVSVVENYVSGVFVAV